jgi:hypothetical protein
VKRFKALFGLAMGLMLASSLMAPAALAQYNGDSVDTGNQTSVSVTVTETGSFDALFCNSSGGYNASTSLSLTTAPTLTTPGLATGSLAICYNDPLAHRPSFDTYVSASAFGGGPTTIPLDGFKVDKTYNVIQQNCTCNGPVRYGDIGQYLNGAYVAQGSTGPGWPMQWSSNNTFDGSIKLQFGYSGVGTGQSAGAFDVSLVLPTATRGGQYASTLTLSIVAGTQP